MRLPRILLALLTEAGALHAVAERVVHSTEQVVREDATQRAIERAARPLDAGVLQHDVVGRRRIASAEAVVGREHAHRLRLAQVAHLVPRRARVLGIAGRVHEPKLVPGAFERAVLGDRLTDEILVGFLDLRVVRGVRHRLVGGGNSAGALGVDLRVFGLATERDPVFASVALGDADDARVRAVIARNPRRARERG